MEDAVYAISKAEQDRQIERIHLEESARNYIHSTRGLLTATDAKTIEALRALAIAGANDAYGALNKMLTATSKTDGRSLTSMNS